MQYKITAKKTETVYNAGPFAFALADYLRRRADARRLEVEKEEQVSLTRQSVSGGDARYDTHANQGGD